jgi:hypothetical protein
MQPQNTTYPAKFGVREVIDVEKEKKKQNN